MAVFRKIFGTKEARQVNLPANSAFRESEGAEEKVSRSAQRRELVKVVLRDTMRKHAIPSDWMGCQIISATNRNGIKGMHVQLVVRKNHEELLGYLFAFQEGFLREIAEFEPRSQEWLFSVGWQFVGAPGHRLMPNVSTWDASTFGFAPHSSLPTGTASAEPTVPSRVAALTGAMSAAAGDDDLERDLKALFEIRDAAIRATAETALAAGQSDFEDTHPSVI